MRKITDLEKIKRIALGFLFLEIGQTEFSPLIVTHPFTNVGVTWVKTNHEYRELNLLENGDELALWRDLLSERIEEAASVDEIICFMNKAYYCAFIKYIEPFLNRKDLSRIWGKVWTQIEFPSQNMNLSKKEITHIFKKCDPCYLMSKVDYTIFKNLKEELKIFRGISKDEMENVKALSWTLSYKKAKWFSNRWSHEGAVYKAAIARENVMACFVEAGEYEVVIDPRYLKCIERVE